MGAVGRAFLWHLFNSSLYAYYSHRVDDEDELCLYGTGSYCPLCMCGVYVIFRGVGTDGNTEMAASNFTGPLMMKQDEAEYSDENLRVD